MTNFALLFVNCSLRFYVLYWFLSLYDLYVPKDVYGQEIEKLQEIVDQPDIHGDDHIQVLYSFPDHVANCVCCKNDLMREVIGVIKVVCLDR